MLDGERSEEEDDKKVLSLCGQARLSKDKLCRGDEIESVVY